RPQAARPGRRRAAARAVGQPALPPLVHRRRAVMTDIPLEGKNIRQLCGIVLIFEAIVIGLASLPAIVLEHGNRGLAGRAGGGLPVLSPGASQPSAAPPSHPFPRVLAGLPQLDIAPSRKRTLGTPTPAMTDLWV